MSTTESVVTIATDKLSSTVVPEPPAPASPPSLSPPEPTVRNQAPGIPDRRKSLRPGKRESRGGRKSSGQKRISIVADMASEMRIKDDDEDRQVWRPWATRNHSSFQLTGSRIPSKMRLPPRGRRQSNPRLLKSRRKLGIKKTAGWESAAPRM